MSSKSILIISSYTVSKLVQFLRHSVYLHVILNTGNKLITVQTRKYYRETFAASNQARLVKPLKNVFDSLRTFRVIAVNTQTKHRN